jgi:prevent-host-death family protein
MYREIGSFDAKATLSALLRDVQNGERYTITQWGRPVADLVPSQSQHEHNAKLAIEEMKNIQKIFGVSTETLLELIRDGRK